MSEIQSIAQRVRATIARSVCVDVSTVTDDKKIADFGCDSMDETEVQLSLEDEFSFVFCSAVGPMQRGFANRFQCGLFRHAAFLFPSP